jgi:hypothetical protein
MKKSKNKNKPIKKEEISFSKIISWLFMITVFFLCTYEVVRGTRTNHLLRKNGICTKAVVYSRENGLRKNGNTRSSYRFYWNDTEYYGYSTLSSDSRTEGKTWINDKYTVGDTIIVVFLESNPNINRSNTQVEKDCGCN